MAFHMPSLWACHALQTFKFLAVVDEFAACIKDNGDHILHIDMTRYKKKS